ncbi:MAG: hypothetical protein Q8J88_11570 [Bacteroidales bacterium]|nr:hypothetical protein [Bacteroidales bacterium]
MKENMSQPKHAARQLLLWNAAFLWHLPENYLPQTARIIYSITSITINSKYDLRMEKQPFSAPHWRYQVLVVYKRLAYLEAMFDALVMRFNPPQQTILWRLAAIYASLKKNKC